MLPQPHHISPLPTPSSRYPPDPHLEGINVCQQLQNLMACQFNLNIALLHNQTLLSQYLASKNLSSGNKNNSNSSTSSGSNPAPKSGNVHQSVIEVHINAKLCKDKPDRYPG